MSRKIIKTRKWGEALRNMRNGAGLSQGTIGLAIGLKGKPEYIKGNVSLIENGRSTITEDKIRLWVKACGKNISHFYLEASTVELEEVRKQSILPKIHHPKK